MNNTIRVFILTLLFSAMLMAQDIPNAGFETWENGNPTGWFTTNIPGFGVPVTQSSESHSGSSAAKLEVVDFSGMPFPPLVTAVFPSTNRPGSLTGFYKFSPQGNDVLTAAIVLYKNSFSEAVGGGVIDLPAAGDYTSFTVPIQYLSSENPDTIYIAFSVSDTSGGETSATIGSFAILDDLAFGGATAVEDIENLPGTFSLKQNYPNPFNPITSITFNIAEASPVTLKIFDVLGNEVSTLINSDMSPGEYNVPFSGAELSSGIYYYTLTAGNFVSTRKMVLLK